MPKSPLRKAKEKLWKLTSTYVRTKDATDGYVNCVTCQRLMHYKEAQAGHFIPRAQGLGTYFELKNIHVQCYRCNINLGGNGPEYYSYMLEKYGQETIDELKAKSKTVVKFNLDDYLDLIECMEGMIDEQYR